MSIKFEYVTGFSPEDFPLPSRATHGSAGYDLCAGEAKVLSPSFTSFVNLDGTLGTTNVVHKIRTGIRIQFPEGVAALVYARSSLFLKKNLMLTNNVGVVDSDYYYAKNEGELSFMLLNFGHEDVVIKKGDKLGQVIFTPYLLTEDDNGGESQRQGGFGSTS
jgi:dUTP pyrophosphatase